MGKQHGMYGTPTYRSWAEMKYRCGNPNRRVYFQVNYDPSWEDFRIFFRDMGVRPKGPTLDRIDGSKGYSKNNCRWATNAEQAFNRKSTHLFEHQGVRLILKDWAKRLGVKESTLSQRIYVYKWPLERALKGGSNCL